MKQGHKKRKRRPARPKNQWENIKFFVSHFQCMFFGPKGLLVAGFARALIGQEVTTKREWLLRRSSELFNPKHKTMRQTQNGIPFQKSPPLMFVPTLCLLDNCLQSALKLYTVPTCGAQHSPKNKTKKTTTFVYEPTTSRSHQHIWNSIKRSKLDLLKEITLHIHALETFWLTVCEFSNVIKRRQLEVCGGGNGHRDNYPTCKNGLWVTPQMEGNKLHGEGSN